MASYWEYALNTALVIAGAVLLKKLLSPSPVVVKKKPKISEFLFLCLFMRLALPLRDFTLDELRRFDGTNEIPELENAKAIYLAVNGTVFDVTPAQGFYGKGLQQKLVTNEQTGGAYECFAGRDATRGLATMQLAVSFNAPFSCVDQE